MFCFADNMKKYRESRGITRKDMAEILNMTPTAYGYYELGKRQPDLEKLVIISQKLGISIDELLGNSIDDYNNCISMLAEYGITVEKYTNTKDKAIHDYKLKSASEKDGFIIFSKTEKEFCDIVESAVAYIDKELASFENELLTHILKRAAAKTAIIELGSLIRHSR